MGKFKKVLKWILIAIVVLYVGVVIYRGFYFYNLRKTEAVVEKIHSTKLTIDDVLGKNLPPDPGAEADKTVVGIDANSNGIRDDVELAIFKEYPNSAKTRAVLLQYALALQMEFTQPIINTVTVTEVITELSRADSCLSNSLVPRNSPGSSRNSADMEKIDVYVNFIESKQLNTEGRKKTEKDFYEYLRSYGESTNIVCDIDTSTLSN